ncbi:hypothetical protein LINPERHAP2_LOCUS1526 [Linum perenne]
MSAQGSPNRDSHHRRGVPRRTTVEASLVDPPSRHPWSTRVDASLVNLASYVLVGGGDNGVEGGVEEDVVDGLYCTSENKWFMTIYFEGKFDHDYGADNEDLYVGRNEENPHLDSMTANSVTPEFVHLVDEDNRTTDDEFEEALYHMGIRRTRRRVAYMDYSSGEEVEQLQASVIGLAGEGIQ